MKKEVTNNILIQNTTNLNINEKYESIETNENMNYFVNYKEKDNYNSNQPIIKEEKEGESKEKNNKLKYSHDSNFSNEIYSTNNSKNTFKYNIIFNKHDKYQKNPKLFSKKSGMKIDTIHIKTIENIENEMNNIKSAVNNKIGGGNQNININKIEIKNYHNCNYSVSGKNEVKDSSATCRSAISGIMVNKDDISLHLEQEAPKYYYKGAISNMNLVKNEDSSAVENKKGRNQIRVSHSRVVCEWIIYIVIFLLLVGLLIFFAIL